MHPVLEVRSVSKRFPSGGGELAVLWQLSLTVGANETVSIRGDSGSGKTTLLNLAAGLEKPDDGEVLWEDRALSGMPGGSLTRQRGRFLGMVFQAYYLVPELDVLGNLLLAARVARRRGQAARARQLLERVGLLKRARERVSVLSGGERQRIAVARALMNQPKIVLADEPTGNLDERNAEGVLGLLIEACEQEGASLVLVTHSAAFAARTQREYRLQGGGLEPVR